MAFGRSIRGVIMSWAEDIVPIPTGTLVLSPDDGCMGVVIQKSNKHNMYKIRWVDGLEKWHWAETFEIIA